MSDWKYYNYALTSKLSPHEQPNLSELDSNWSSLANGNKPLFATWTEEFDCGFETSWWYCICDKPFDIASLKAKRRNVINNGIKYCDVKIVNPLDYFEDLYEMYEECQNTYPTKNRKDLTKDEYKEYLLNLNNASEVDFYACFLKEDGKCVGYAVVTNHEHYVDFTSQKARPEYEKYQVNAALVNAVLNHYKDVLSRDYYICDGSRNINHETRFQDFLEKYFGFRKAYCFLKIKYKPLVKVVVYLLYPIRRIIGKFDGIKSIHLVNSLLLMEQCKRNKNG